MKKTIGFRKILVVLLLPFVVWGIYSVVKESLNSNVSAIDPLVITFDGNTTPDPVFEVNNMLPGDEVEKEVKVKNNLDVGSFNVNMDGILTFETSEFADILEIVISEVPGGDIYGGSLGYKSLQNFLDDPPLDLGNFVAGQEKTFRIKIKFPLEAGNEYQLAKVVFDLKFTTFVDIDLPEECASLAGLIENVVEGTEGNDKLKGSVKHDLILAKGGNDKIDSSSSADCVVGGDGDDDIRSESGDDIIIAGDGNDKIKSGSGNDVIYGGSGDDNIDGGTGEDIIYGDSGDDNIDAGSDDDLVYAGAGNDKISGGTGVDNLYGEEGNDQIKGGSNDDFLFGGADSDNLHGNSGTDTCTQGETLNSCEL